MATMPDLAPRILEWMALDKKLLDEVPDFFPEPDAFRAGMVRVSDTLAEQFAAPLADGVAIDNVSLPGCRPLRRYRPEGAAPDEALATMIYLHGGGFVHGSIVEVINDRLCAARVARTGVQVIAVEYRLAPEHPYPAAVEDIEAVIDALIDDPGALGVDPQRIGLDGISAGGGLAATVALRLRDAGDSPIRRLLLEVPGLSLQPHGPHWDEYAEIGGADQLALVAMAYVQDPDADDGYASPLLAEDVSGLPPTTILTAEHDLLRDGGEDFGVRLQEAGVPVTVWRGDGHIHASHTITADFPPAQEWEDHAVVAFEALAGGASATGRNLA